MFCASQAAANEDTRVTKYLHRTLRVRNLFLLIVVSLTGNVLGEGTEPRRPNVVFILADDLGWSELGCYGNTFHETPHLDRLATEGMRFTSAYAAAPVCSPYRAALLTGQHPARIGILDYLRPNSSNALSTSHTTLPEVLSRHGYETGMIGKWHLTGYRYHDAEFEITPRDHGFAWDTGREIKGVGNGANFWPYVFRDQDVRWLDLSSSRLGPDEYLTDRLNLEAVDFIEANRDRPFFLYLSHYAPHTILNGRPDLVEKYRNRHVPGKSTREHCYLCRDSGLAGDAGNHWAGSHNPHLAAMLESIDNGVGLIAEKLDDLGIAGNTIFIFTSDNGGETNVTSNAPLRGGKSQLYEGGIRVPLIVRWPGRVPAGTVCERPTANYDFYPTLLDAADIEPVEKQLLDGRSILSTWQDPLADSDAADLYWHYPLDQPHFLGGESAGAVRSGNWKLIENFEASEDSRFELYNLDEDLSESKNLSREFPERVHGLSERLNAWRKLTGARVPSSPLLVAPRNLDFGDHFSEGQVSARWFFTSEWTTRDGALIRTEFPGENQRIFLKEPEFRNCMIRFDFQFNGAEDLRLVTGSSGHYNAVIHIRPDHFFIQTASDSRGPYFSRRHGECAFRFMPGSWYTMTVEFNRAELVAHLDHEHLAYATHPILNQDRTYFAFQVDRPSAAIDNVQLFRAVEHPDHVEHSTEVRAAAGRYPVTRSLKERYEIQKEIAHDTLYQSDSQYRKLVQQHDRLKEDEKQAYPRIFRSHKEVRNEIAGIRRKLLAEDPEYKETLFATYRAARAIDSYLTGKMAGFDSLPASRRPAVLEQLRRQYGNEAEYRRLMGEKVAADQRLIDAYPQLFVSDEDIHRQKRELREAHADDPEFRKLVNATANGWRALQEYLHTHDETLGRLRDQIQAGQN